MIYLSKIFLRIGDRSRFGELEHFGDRSSNGLGTGPRLARDRSRFGERSRVRSRLANVIGTGR